MAKHYDCEGCAHLANPYGSPGFKEHCLGCQIADVEAAVNTLSPYGFEVRYMRTNYQPSEAVQKGDE